MRIRDEGSVDVGRPQELGLLFDCFEGEMLQMQFTHHLEVSEDAEMEKKVARMLDAIARPMSVLPVPGGPNSSSPRAGARAPCVAAGNAVIFMSAAATRGQQPPASRQACWWVREARRRPCHCSSSASETGS